MRRILLPLALCLALVGVMGNTNCEQPCDQACQEKAEALGRALGEAFLPDPDETCFRRIGTVVQVANSAMVETGDWIVCEANKRYYGASGSLIYAYVDCNRPWLPETPQETAWEYFERRVAEIKHLQEQRCDPWLAEINARWEGYPVGNDGWQQDIKEYTAVCGENTVGFSRTEIHAIYGGDAFQICFP